MLNQPWKCEGREPAAQVKPELLLLTYTTQWDAARVKMAEFFHSAEIWNAE